VTHLAEQPAELRPPPLSEGELLHLIRRDLPRAIARHDLSVLYQPIVRLVDGRLAGAEALVRWYHPARGAIPVEPLLTACERSGTVLPITQWVFAKALHAAARWPEPLTLSANLSATLLGETDMAERLEMLIAESGLSPSRLFLEITETAAVPDWTRAKTLMDRLGALGVRFALDDFGVGHSSLEQLATLPVARLKLDCRFVGTDRRCAAIRATVGGLAAECGAELVAEGLEARGDVAAARLAGCAYGQGYGFGRPMAAWQFAELAGRTGPVALAA
jgi:EAL domain-containing protein (putative c-di-GMP-specific phosphodiesterase class I)